MQRFPSFNTPEYWQAYNAGLITDAQTVTDQLNFDLRSQRAKKAKYNRAIAPHRHNRPAPRESKQYCKNMATTAARDDRLTPQAKALLQIIVARTGGGFLIETCKYTLALILSRCPRSIQRYIQELIKFGYIRTQTRIDKLSGLYTGLKIWITQAVLPFFSFKNQDDMTENRSNPKETKKSPIKETNSKKKFSEKKTEKLRKKVDDG